MTVSINQSENREDKLPFKEELSHQLSIIIRFPFSRYVPSFEFINRLILLHYSKCLVLFSMGIKLLPYTLVTLEQKY